MCHPSWFMSFWDPARSECDNTHTRTHTHTHTHSLVGSFLCFKGSIKRSLKKEDRELFSSSLYPRYKKTSSEKASVSPQPGRPKYECQYDPGDIPTFLNLHFLICKMDTAICLAGKD